MESIQIGPRKVGKKGEGMCLMLPSIWIRNANVSVGDELRLKMRGKELVIEPEMSKK